MSQMIIRGGIPLEGEIQISGSKHSALAILGSVLLTRGRVKIENMPQIQDVHHMLSILHSLGVTIERNDDSEVMLGIEKVSFSSNQLWRVSKLRSSILFLGSILVRNKWVTLPLPGGDKLGERPIEEFLYVLDQFGILYTRTATELRAELETSLRGHREINLVSKKFPLMGNNRTVLALILAWANQGRTVIRNALVLPEVIEVCDFLELISEGWVTIDGIGTDTLVINSPGINRIHRNACYVHHILGPDKCEYAFWIAAASLTHGCITFTIPYANREIRNSLRWVRAKLLRPANIPMEITGYSNFRVNCLTGWHRPTAFHLNAPYHEQEGIAFDASPLFATILFKANGNGYFRCGRFGKERVRWAYGLEQIGAKYLIHPDGALEIAGVEKLIAHAPVQLEGDDIRGASALLLLALATEGHEIQLSGLSHILRGMEHPIEKLHRLGANIIVQCLAKE